MGSWTGIEEVVAAANAGSFAGGARALGISTSQMSRAIAELEDRLSVPLFARSTRRIALTDAGRVLCEQFARLVRERDEAFSMVDGAEPQGTLKMTCSVALGERFIAPIVRRFQSDFPRLGVKLTLTNQLIDLVSEGFDLAVRTGSLADSQLVSTRIASRRLYLCATPDYLARAGVPAEPADLRDHACVLGSASTWHFEVNGEAYAFRPAAQWQCNSGNAAVDAVLAHLGICQLPEFYVVQHIARGEMISILDAFRPPDQPIWAVYPQRRHLLPKVRLLIDRLRRELGPALTRVAQA